MSRFRVNASTLRTAARRAAALVSPNGGATLSPWYDMEIDVNVRRVRTVAVPPLRRAVSAWMRRLDSELVVSGDDGTTGQSRPSTERSVERTIDFNPLILRARRITSARIGTPLHAEM